jgi:hypothetical protein
MNPEIFTALITQVVIPEIMAVIKYLQAQGEVVTEAAILAQLEARGRLQIAQVDAWLAAHPSDPTPAP